MTSCREVSAHSSAILAELIPKYLDKDASKVLTGDKGIVTKLPKHPFGHILYIGGAEVGKIISAAASKNLTPVTLELGGKNPVMVTEKASITLAAKRIAWSKYYAVGQLRIAPDYVLAQESVLAEFVAAMKKVRYFDLKMLQA